MSLTFANKITVCRILLVPFFVDAVLYYTPEQDYLRFVALAIFMFAVLSDLVDGYVARRWYQKTKAGALLDPLADKLLLISAFISLYKVGVLFPAVRFPVWLVVTVISRDVILLLGVMILYLVRANAVIETTFWGKWTTALQMASVMVMLLQWPQSFWLWLATLFFSIVSLIDYIIKGIQAINNGVKPA
jgi:CDP-diacylglycerol--glycerol-3-phosphate 3-phosphatidyltransferase